MTGALHIGHALTAAIQVMYKDIFARTLHLVLHVILEVDNKMFFFSGYHYSLA